MANPTKVDLVGVGLNATDTIIPLSTYPARGSKVEYHTATVLPGGQVASTVVACQHWGMRTRYVGKLGDDTAATLHREAFARAGVETQIITVSGGASPQSLILVDGGGERTVLCRRDERLILQPSDLDRDWIVNARALHVDGHDTAAATLATRWAREAGIPVIADLDELYPGVEELIANIDYLIVSRDFPCRLMAEPDLEQALQQMQRRYSCASPPQPSAKKAYSRGMASSSTTLPPTPSGSSTPPVPETSSTPASSTDSCKDWPLDRQLDFACAAAALNCTAVGARGNILSFKI